MSTSLKPIEEAGLSLKSGKSKMYWKSEYDIHDIIKYHPYLLGKEFEHLVLKHEKIYGDRTRADFVFADDKTSIVIEVKKGEIDIEMLNQAIHYLDNERKENPAKKLKGILIGSRVMNNITIKLQDTKYLFEIKLLNIDVPTEIKLCSKCRKANSLFDLICKYCGSKKFITDPFLLCPTQSSSRTYENPNCVSSSISHRSP